jgi:hypothetical protein
MISYVKTLNHEHAMRLERERNSSRGSAKKQRLRLEAEKILRDRASAGFLRW